MPQSREPLSKELDRGIWNRMPPSLTNYIASIAGTDSSVIGRYRWLNTEDCETVNEDLPRDQVMGLDEVAL